MNPKPKIVISASRRTDIPAFYMPWFMERVERGVFEVVKKIFWMNCQKTHLSRKALVSTMIC
jgi:hypothetical protein